MLFIVVGIKKKKEDLFEFVPLLFIQATNGLFWFKKKKKIVTSPF